MTDRLDPILPQKPARLDRGLQHIAWSIAPAVGTDVEPRMGFEATHLQLWLVPIVSLAAPLRATRLALFGEASHTGVFRRLDLMLSLWRASAPVRSAPEGSWTAQHLASTPVLRAQNPSSVSTTTKLIAGELTDSQLLSPPQIYFVGVEVDESPGEAFVVRAPQGDFPSTQQQFLSAWSTSIPARSTFDRYPDQVSNVRPVPHFFAAALSDAGWQFFVERD